MAVSLGEEAEGVDEAGLEEGLEAGALLVGEAMGLVIGAGVGKVFLGVGDIEIAAEDNGLFLLELFAVGQEGRIPMLPAHVQAGEFALAVGGVNGDQPEFGILGGQDSPLFIGVTEDVTFYLVFVDNCLGQAAGDVERLGFAEDGGAGVAFLFGRVPVFVILWQVDFSLTLFSFGFLNTQNIRLVLGDKRLKSAFIDDCADAVDVPGVDFHAATASR